MVRVGPDEAAQVSGRLSPPGAARPGAAGGLTAVIRRLFKTFKV